MKAPRNRIRQHKRRPRLRMESNPAPRSWVRNRFVTTPRLPPPTVFSGELVDDMLAFNRGLAKAWPAEFADPVTAEVIQPTFGERLRERFRILGWIFRLLRR